jgi:membrane protein implicated in regulation of membrane protease activity
VKQLRKLVFGETWTLPLGVAAVVLIGYGVRALLPADTWEDGGGFVLLALVLAALLAALIPAHRARGR